MGVWIEISITAFGIEFGIVTPRVGVWIEILLYSTNTLPVASLPVWECGLKFTTSTAVAASVKSLPVWECGLKFVHFSIHHLLTGHVTPRVGVWIEIPICSIVPSSLLVTPRVGVWIEILTLTIL